MIAWDSVFSSFGCFLRMPTEKEKEVRDAKMAKGDDAPQQGICVQRIDGTFQSTSWQTVIQQGCYYSKLLSFHQTHSASPIQPTTSFKRREKFRSAEAIQLTPDFSRAIEDARAFALSRSHPSLLVAHQRCYRPCARAAHSPVRCARYFPTRCQRRGPLYTIVAG